METEQARERLEEMLGDLDHAAQELRDENAHDSSELSSLDQHPADTGSEVAEADREDASLEALAEQRVQVVAALDRIREGTYGRCLVDGEAIDPGRLEARPEAALCLRHQQEQEEARR